MPVDSQLIELCIPPDFSEADARRKAIRFLARLHASVGYTVTARRMELMHSPCIAPLALLLLK